MKINQFYGSIAIAILVAGFVLFAFWAGGLDFTKRSIHLGNCVVLTGMTSAFAFAFSFLCPFWPQK